MRSRISKIMSIFTMALVLVLMPIDAYAADEAVFALIKSNGSEDEYSHNKGSGSTDFEGYMSFKIYIYSYTQMFMNGNYDSMTVTYKNQVLSIEKGAASTTSDGKLTIPEKSSSSYTQKEIKEIFNADPDLESYLEKVFTADAITTGKQDEQSSQDYADSLSITSSISNKVQEAIGALLDWVVEKAGESLDEIVFEFTTKFGPDVSSSSIISSLVPSSILLASQTSFLTIGWILLVLITVFALLFCMIGGITGYEEHWFAILARATISAFMVVNAMEIMRYLFNFTWGIMGTFNNSLLDSSGGSLSGIIQQTSDLSIILKVIFVVMILWNVLKLLLVVIQRYFVVVLLYYASPVAFATFASGATAPICMSYIKMMISNLVAMTINMWFMKLIAAVIANGDSYFEANSGSMDAIIFYLGLLAVLNVAQSLNSYLADLGFTASRAAGGLIGAAAGVASGLVVAAQGARSIGRLINGGGGGSSSRNINNGNSNAKEALYGAYGSGGTHTTGQKGLMGKIGDAITKGTGNRNMMDRNGNVVPGRNNPNPVKDFVTQGAGVMNKEGVSDVLQRGKFHIPNNSDIVSGNMHSRNGVAEGHISFKNKDTGQISTMELSTTPKPGYTKLSGVNNDDPIYGKLQQGSTPIGGTGFENINAASHISGDSLVPESTTPLPAGEIAARTGNFTENQMADLGMDNLSYDNMLVQPTMDPNVHSLYDSETGEFTGTIGYGSGENTIVNDQGNQVFANPRHIEADYDAMQNSAQMKAAYGVTSETPEMLGNGMNANPDEGYALFEIGVSKNGMPEYVAMKDPAYFEKGANDKEFNIDGKTWYAEKTESITPNNKRVVYGLDGAATSNSENMHTATLGNNAQHTGGMEGVGQSIGAQTPSMNSNEGYSRNIHTNGVNGNPSEPVVNIGHKESPEANIGTQTNENISGINGYSLNNHAAGVNGSPSEPVVNIGHQESPEVNIGTQTNENTSGVNGYSTNNHAAGVNGSPSEPIVNIGHQTGQNSSENSEYLHTPRGSHDDFEPEGNIGSNSNENLNNIRGKSSRNSEANHKGNISKKDE